MSASRAVATALYLALWAGAAVFALAWLASLGVDAESARLQPGGSLYVTRSVAILYGIAALPLALLVAHRLGGSRLPTSFLLASSLTLTGVVAWFWKDSGPEALLGAAFFRDSGYSSRLLARAVFALATVLPLCVLGWSLARLASGHGRVVPVQLDTTGTVLLGALFTLFLLAAPYYHEPGYFSSLASRANNALPDLFYEEAEVNARRIQLLGGDTAIAGLPLERFLATVAESKEAYRTKLQSPDTLRDLAQRFPLANPLLTLGRYEEAEAEIEAVLRQDPDHPRALMDRARLSRLRDEDLEHTRELFADAARAARGRAGKPVLIRVLSLYADACYRTQDFARAEALYLEALDIEESAQLHLDLAHVYRREGRGRLGAQHVRRAIELQPEIRTEALGRLQPLLQDSFDCAPTLATW